MKCSEPSCRLIALTLGLPPYAETINCGDLTGPSSLFGDIGQLPKPLHCSYETLVSSVATLCSPLCQEALVLYDANHPYPGAEAFAVSQTTYLTSTVTSTFDVGWKLVQHDLLPEWGAVLATRQTDGRGQMRREWTSPSGNLYVSFRLPASPLFQGDAVAVVVGAMLVRALDRMGYSLKLKWPNDLLDANGNKTGGILVEERQNVLLVGLGLNLNSCPNHEQLRPDTACSAGILAKSELLPGEGNISPFEMWRVLVQECMRDFSERLVTLPVAELLQKTTGKLAWLNEFVTVSDFGEKPCQGRCLGFGENGGLLLRLDSGEEQEVTSGSVCLLSR